MRIRRLQCSCSRCRKLPEPFELGDAHATAVVLFLDADGARAVADGFQVGDKGGQELYEAADRWEAMRDA